MEPEIPKPSIDFASDPIVGQTKLEVQQPKTDNSEEKLDEKPSVSLEEIMAQQEKETKKQAAAKKKQTQKKKQGMEYNYIQTDDSEIYKGPVKKTPVGDYPNLEEIMKEQGKKKK